MMMMKHVRRTGCINDAQKVAYAYRAALFSA